MHFQCVYVIVFFVNLVSLKYLLLRLENNLNDVPFGNQNKTSKFSHALVHKTMHEARNFTVQGGSDNRNVIARTLQLPGKRNRIGIHGSKLSTLLRKLLFSNTEPNSSDIFQIF